METISEDCSMRIAKAIVAEACNSESNESVTKGSVSREGPRNFFVGSSWEPSKNRELKKTTRDYMNNELIE